MACVTADQPLRVQTTKNGVVHAAMYQKYGGFQQHLWDSVSGVSKGTRMVPVEELVIIACRRWNTQMGRDNKKNLVDSRKKITCKACMKVMGLLDAPPAERFVIRKKSTGEFYKNTNTRCNSWSDDLYDAYMFKKKHTARAHCTYNVYDVGDGKLYTYSEWSQIKRPAKRVEVFKEDLEILKVRIEVVNEKVNKNNRRAGRKIRHSQDQHR